MKKGKTKGIGIRAKILFPTSVVITLLCIVIGVTSYQRIKEGLVAMGVEEAQMAAIISAKVIDAEQVAEISADTKEDEAYNTLLEAMLGIMQDCGIEYLYTLYTDKDKVYYGIDADSSGNGNQYGTVFEVPYQELKSVFDGEMYVQDYIDSTEDGDLISAYMPLVACTKSSAPWPPTLWQRILRSSTIIYPGQLKVSVGLTAPDSSPAAAVMILKVDPGSYVSLMQPLRHIPFNRFCFSSSLTVPASTVSGSA